MLPSHTVLDNNSGSYLGTGNEHHNRLPFPLLSVFTHIVIPLLLSHFSSMNITRKLRDSLDTQLQRSPVG